MNMSIRSSDYQNRQYPYYAPPIEYLNIEIGSFSVDATREFVGDRSRLRYLRMPENNHGLNWDLNKGMADHSYIPGTPKIFMKLLCHWIIKNRAGECRLKEAVHGADFVFGRGCLTHICGSPYDRQEGLKVAVTHVDGVYFLAKYETQQKIDLEASLTEREKTMSYWGEKFETFIGANVDGNIDTESPVISMEQFCLVMTSMLDTHPLLLFGEVDCQDPVNGDYVELKTTRSFGSARHETQFHRFKTLRWWLQSFIVGITRIMAGIRSDDGIVSHIREWRLEDLRQDRRRLWDEAVCLNFASSVFDLIKKSITLDDPKQVWLLERQPGQWELAPPRKLSGEENEDHSFLEQSFLDHFGL